MTTDIRYGRPPGTALLAYGMLVVCALCWAANAIFGRLAVGEISPMALVLLRWLGTFLLLMVFANRYVRRDWPVLKPYLPRLALMGAIGFSCFNGLFYVAAHYTTAVNLGILQGSLPVLMLVGAFLAYRTRVTWLQGFGAALTLSGVVLVATGGNILELVRLGVNFGDFLMILACICYAGYGVSLRQKPEASSLGLFTVLVGAALITAIPMALAEAAFGEFKWPGLNGWIIVALVTLFPSFLAQLFFIKGVEAIGPGRAGLFINLVPVFAAILAVTILAEPFEIFQAMALGLVLGGIWLAERGKPAQPDKR